MSKWAEIRNDYVENDKIFIDAWLTDADDEEGSVIAKIDSKTKEIDYLALMQKQMNMHKRLSMQV